MDVERYRSRGGSQQRCFETLEVHRFLFTPGQSLMINAVVKHVYPEIGGSEKKGPPQLTYVQELGFSTVFGVYPPKDLHENFWWEVAMDSRTGIVHRPKVFSIIRMMVCARKHPFSIGWWR